MAKENLIPKCTECEERSTSIQDGVCRACRIAKAGKLNAEKRKAGGGKGVPPPTPKEPSISKNPGEPIAGEVGVPQVIVQKPPIPAAPMTENTSTSANPGSSLSQLATGAPPTPPPSSGPPSEQKPAVIKAAEVK